MIGKYLSQFGWGWEDTYTRQSDDAPDWYQDDPATPERRRRIIRTPSSSTATRPMFFHYRDMRGEANDLLDKGNVAMEVVLVNHVLSALDAAFAVRSYNKRVTATPEPNLGDLHLRYDIRANDQSRSPCACCRCPFRWTSHL